MPRKHSLDGRKRKKTINWSFYLRREHWIFWNLEARTSNTVHYHRLPWPASTHVLYSSMWPWTQKYCRWGNLLRSFLNVLVHIAFLQQAHFFLPVIWQSSALYYPAWLAAQFDFQPVHLPEIKVSRIIFNMCHDLQRRNFNGTNSF